MKASDLFVKAMEAEGVRYIFAVPGEDLVESLRGSSIGLVATGRNGLINSSLPLSVLSMRVACT